MTANRVKASVSLAALLTLACPGSGVARSAAAELQPAHVLTLDTHLDTPVHFGRPGWSILDRHSADSDLSQVDLPRMKEGGLDGGFWAIFTEQGDLTPAAYAAARDFALLRALQIREMVARNPASFELAKTAADAGRIAAAGRRVVYLSIENSYPLGTDLSLLDTFYRMGVRLVGPVHYSNNQFADSATDPRRRWQGLSPRGRQLVERANHLGMILDASHASDDTLDQMMELSKTPIVLSHSGLKATLDHPRNIDDTRLRRLAASGGVIQLYAVSEYLVKTPVVEERETAFQQRSANLAHYSGAQAAAMAVKMRALDAKYRIPVASLDDFMRMLLHAIEVAGVDHVGIGADWDGGAGLKELPDVAALSKVPVRLRKAGYSREQIGKIMGGNVIRVLTQVESYAREQQRQVTER
jgi:membrane dipeptidase